MAKNRKRSTIIAELREKANAPQAQRGSDIEREKQNSSREEILADLRNVAAGGKPGANKINEAYAEYRQKKEQARADRYQSLVRDTQSLFDGNGRLNSGVTTQQLGQLSQRTREIYKERTESNAKFLKDLDSYLQRLAAGQLASGMTSKLLPQEQRDALRDQIAGQAPWDRTVTRRRSGAGTTTTGSPTGDAGGGAGGVPLLSQYKRAESGAEAQILQNTARIAELERRAQAWGAMQGGTGDREAQAEILRLEDQNRQLEAQKKAYRRAGETERLRQEMPERPEAYTPENAAQYLARGKYLASKDAWTEEDRAEARELQAALVQPVWADSAVKHAEAGDILDIQQVAEDLQTRLNATGDARLLGLPGETGEALDRFISQDLGEMTALGQGLIRGTGAQSLARGIFAGNEDTQAQIDRGDRQYEFLMQNGGTGVQASGFVGNTLGSVAGMTAAAGAAGGVLGAVPGFVSLSPGLQAAAKTAAAFMTQDAVSNLGAEMTGEMTMDEYMGGIVRSGLAGMVGQTASGLVNSGIAQLLSKHDLMTPFMEFVRQMAGSTAFTAAKTGTELALTERQDLPSGEQLAQQMAAAFLFSAVNSAIGTIETTRESRARMEASVAQMQQDFEKISTGAKSAEDIRETGDRILRYSRDIRQTISQNYYPGQQAYIDQVRSMLDTLDERVGALMQGTVPAPQPGITDGAAPAGYSGIPGAPDGLVPSGGGQAAQAEGPGAQEIAQQLQQAVQQGVRDQANRQEAEALYQQYGETAGAAAAQRNEDLAAELQREYGPVYRQNRALEAQEAAAQKSAAPADRSGTEAPAAPRQAAQEPTNGAERQTTSRTGKSGGAARQAAETAKTARTAPAAQERKRTGYVQPAGGTPVAGTDVVRVEQAGDGGLTLLRADGSTAALSDVKTAGTALEVLRAAEELPEYKDPLTLNGMLRAYEGYLGGGQSTPARAEDFLDSYAIALTAGAEGESRSALAGITEDSRLRSAMETGYRRGAEISKGKRLAQHLGSAGAAALEEHGYRYPEEFGAFYQAGQEGLSFPEAKRMAGVSGLGEVRKAVFTAAWEAGRKDGNDYEENHEYDLGFEEDHGGNAVSLDRGERTGRLGAREPAQDLAGGAGKAEVSAKSLGVANGTDRKTARVLRDTELTDGMRGIRKDARERGLRVDFVRGTLELQVAGRTLNARGAQVGNRLIVQADNPSASFREIYRHERLHAQIARGDIPLAQAVETVRRAIGMESWERLLPEYRKAYEGVYTGERFERNVQEELCADAAAGLLKGHGAVDLSNLERGQKNSAPAERGTRFALKEYSEQQKQNWSASKRIVIYSGQEQLENFVRDSISDKTMSKKMYFGAISNDLAERILADTGINVENYNLSLGSYEIRKILKDHGDGIKEAKRGQRAIVPEDFAHIMDVVLNPDKITLSDDTYMEKPAIIFTGNYNGRMNVVAVVSDKRLDLFVQTAYVNVKKGNLAMPTDERASVNTPGANNGTASFGNTVAQDKEKSQEAKLSVSAPERDSAGRELSAEQAEYFKDSKVRDAEGNLKPVYHGSGAEFTEFSHKFGGSHGSAEGQGFYFTDKRSMAEGYQKNGTKLMEGYLDIQNPLSDSELTLSRREVTQLVKAIDPTGDDLVSNYDSSGMGYPSRAWYNRALRETVDVLMQNDTDSELMGEIANAFGDREPVLKAAREQLGYDGYIVDGKYDGATVYVAFDSNQFKNADNKSPTTNPDIRYSVSEEVEPTSSAEYAQMQRGRAPAGPSEREAAEQRKRQVTLLSHMTERAFELRRQFTEGTQRDLNTTDIPGVAADLLRFAGRKAMGRGELEQRLSDIAMKAARSQNPMEAYQVAKEEADYLAADMMRNATGQTDESTKAWDELKRTLRSATSIQKNGRLATGPVKLAITGQNRADLDREGGYEHLRKRLMGYAFLSAGGTPVEEFYQEKLSPKFPEYFPDTIQNPADQLIRIVDVLDQFRQIFKSPWAGDAAEDTELLSQEIMQRLYNANVQAPSAEAYAAQREEMLQAYYEGRIREQRDALRRRMDEMEQWKRDDRTRRAEKQERDFRFDHIKKTYQRLSDMLWKNTDKLHVPEPLKAPLGEFLREIDLASWTAWRGDGMTVQDVRFAQSLRRIANVLDQQLRFQEGEKNAKDLFLGYLDLPADYTAKIREWTERIEGLLDPETYSPRGGVVSMKLQQIQELDQIMTTLHRAITNINRLIADGQNATVAEVAGGTIRELNRLAARPLHVGVGERTPGNLAKNFFQWVNTTPYYAFKRFGSGGQTIFKGLQDGWDKLARNTAQVIAFSEKAWTAKEAREWERETHEIKLTSGETILLTTPQVMDLYNLSGRQQALGHLLGGGIKPAGYSEAVLLTRADVDSIRSLLTKRQRAVAEAMQRYAQETGGQWGNEVSMRRYGYRFFTEDHYWPMKTDSNEQDAQDNPGRENSMFRIANLSATKSTVEGANNALTLRNAFEVFSDHMTDMAKYNALVLPMLDAMKWFNYKERTKLESGQVRFGGTRQAIDRAWGGAAKRYFTDFIKDLNGTSEGGRGTAFADKMISNMKVAAVAANLRVALLQGTSIVRAALVLPPKYLIKAQLYAPRALWHGSGNVFRGREGGLTGEMLQWSGIARWKSMGFFDTNISRGVREQILHKESIKDKITEASMSLAELGDTATWTVIWKACKLEQQDRGYSGDELLERTAERFRDVIYATQVVDSTMTRSHMMRSKDGRAKSLTPFMSEPTLTYNTLLDAAMEIQQENRRGRNGWKTQKGKLFRTFAVFAASAALSALVESLSEAARDDDDEPFLDKLLDALLGEKIIDGNLVQDLVPLGSLPYLNDAVSIFRGYSSERMETTWMSKVYNVIKIYNETAKLANGELDKATKVTSYGSMTEWGKLYKALDALSTTVGLPIAAFSREVTSVWNATIGAISPRMKIKRYESKDQKLEWLYSFARSGSTADYEKELAGLRRTFSGGKTGEEITEDIQDGLRGKIKDHYLDGDLTEQEAQRLIERYTGRDAEEAEAYVAKWNCEKETGMKYDDLKDLYLAGELTDKQAVKYRVKYGLQDEEKAKDTVTKWRYEKETGDEDASASMASAWYDIAKPAGIDREVFAEAWDFKQNVEGDKDSSGKTVPGSAKQKVVDYIQGLGLGRDQEKALWDALKGNWKDTDTPWE